MYLQGTACPEGGGGGEACLYCFRIYLQGTVCQGYSQVIQFPNLPPGNCLLGVQLIDTVSEPTSRGLSVGGAACFHSFGTYLQKIVGQWCGLFIPFPKQPKRYCRPEVQHINTVSDLPPGDCKPGSSQ